MYKEVNIFWGDLTKEKQEEIQHEFGMEPDDNGNWDVFPLATVGSEVDEDFNLEDWKINVGSYEASGLCMALILENGDEDIIVTKFLGIDIGNDTVMQPFTAYIDMNNVSKEVMDALVEAGIMKPYVRFGEEVKIQSGFVTYPLYQFNAVKLTERDKEGCEKYMAAWSKAFEEWKEDQMAW